MGLSKALPFFYIGEIMKIRFYITIGSLFVLAGALLGYQYYSPFLENSDNNVHAKTQPQAQAQPQTQTQSQTQLITSSKQSATTPPIIGQPTHISIPSLNISDDIVPGYYNKITQSWTLSNTQALFATVTSIPNSKAGNTFIYGHARAKVFANLINAKKGTKVTISTNNGHIFTYLYASQRDVSPSDVSLFNYSGKPLLTLQTCSGLWSENRRLITFNLVGVK